MGDAPGELSITSPLHHSPHNPKLALKQGNNRFVRHQAPFFFPLCPFLLVSGLQPLCCPAVKEDLPEGRRWGWLGSFPGRQSSDPPPEMRREHHPDISGA